MYYFFKTFGDRGRNRLRPLSGQVLSTGEDVRVDYNVKAEAEIRASYPLGTIFASPLLSDMGGFYASGRLYPILNRDEDYLTDSHKPSVEMLDAYKHWIGLSGEDVPKEVEEDDIPESQDSPTPRTNTLLIRMRSNKELKPPTIKSEGFFVDADDWYLLVRNIQAQIPVMLTGPRGVGKTELVSLVSKRLNLDYTCHDMGSLQDPMSGLLGVHRLKDGASVFDYAQFTKDISKPGVVLLDELSRAPVLTNNILFPCLDSRRSLYVDIAGGSDRHVISVHEDCSFVATANIGSEYTGTFVMDPALVARFFPLELSFMPRLKEVSVLCIRTGISKNEATQIIDVATEIRKLWEKQEISCPVSHRETLRVAELVVDGWSLIKALELVILPLYEGNVSDGERSIILKLFTSK